jgi:predicted acetyltransferase
MSNVDVTVASFQQKSVLENLFQLYVHDFSEHWAGMPDGELGDDGRFEAYPLGSYWTEADRVALLLKVDGRPAGFALLNRVSPTGRVVDRNMAEFFIVRKHRRGGVGTAAAGAILARYGGVWEIAVARRNLAALSFWRRIVGSQPLIGDLEEIDQRTALWNGPVFRFQVGEAASDESPSSIQPSNDPASTGDAVASRRP